MIVRPYRIAAVVESKRCRQAGFTEGQALTNGLRGKSKK